jgi:hypothetical protein
MSQLKGLVRSRFLSKRSIVEVYVAKEVIEFYTNFWDGIKPIDHPKSWHEGRLHGSDIIGYKIISMSLKLW